MGRPSIRERGSWLLLAACLAWAGCPQPADDDSADDVSDDDDATGDDDATSDDDATGDDDATSDDDATGDDDATDAPALEDLGGYLAVLYTHMILPIAEQELADAGGRFYTYAGGTDPGTFETMEIDTCEYFGPGNNSTFGDLSFLGRTAGTVNLLLGNDSIMLYPGTSEEDGAPIYQNGGLTPGGNHQFDAWYGIDATGADVPAFHIEEAIHVPPDAEPVTPPLGDGWMYTGGDWPVSWTGTSEGEVRISLMINEGFVGAHEVLCRLADDGEHTIPGAVFADVPNSGYIRTGSLERLHTLHYALPDGTVLETYGSNLYVFDWEVSR